MIGVLCRWFPGLRLLWVGIGYVLLVAGGVVWFICFPLTARTLHEARQFPFEYFEVPFSLPFPLEFYLPADMLPRLEPVCEAFALYGLVLIYFNTRKLRRLRRAEK